MKRDWMAIHGLVILLLVLAVSLAGIDWVTAHNPDSILVPSADTVAENFTSALAAHRPEGSIGELSAEMQVQVDEADLYQLVRQIEANQGSIITHVDGLDAAVVGDAAQAKVRILFTNGMERVVEIALSRENRLWKVTNFDSLKALAIKQ